MMAIARDFYKYMDTTYPKNVDRDKYLHLKYSNREQIRQLTRKYEEIDPILLEKIAVHELLQKEEHEIIEKIMQYKE